MPFVLSIVMSAIISFIATLRTLGVSPDLFESWIKSWALSWIIAFPTLFAVLPIVRKIVATLVEPPSEG
jgi:Protein of unknown function (DUF2798)